MVYSGLTNPIRAAARYLEQSGFQVGQMQAIIAAAGQFTGVISGCAVTAQGTPDTTVAVAAGRVVVNNTSVAVTSGNVSGFTAPASGNRRIDLVVVDNTGAKSRLAGTAATPADTANSGPMWPSTYDPTVYAVLAEVVVDAGDSTIVAGCITDKRLMVYPVNGVGGITNPPFASAYTPDPYVATTHNVGTLTAAITINAPSNSYPGCPLRFIFTQDGTGGRVVTFNAAFKTNWTPVTTAGKKNSISFVYDGTNWIQVATATGM